tara:strand:- start:10742 stop:11362 length:621 start_codon:yes stop_codon:yes gene_type:complete
MSITEYIINKKKTCEEIYKEYKEPWNQMNFGDIYKKEFIIFLCNFSYNNLNCKKIFEVGCGLGHYTNLIDNKTKLLCEGGDISKTAINKCNLLYKNINFVILDVTNIDNLINICEKYDILIFLDITWYILENLDKILKILKKHFKNKYIIHSLVMYEKQTYGNEYFSNHIELLKYFDLTYLFETTCGEKNKYDTNFKYNSIFLGKI